MQRISIIISTILFFLAQPVFAADQEVRSWIVSQKSGSVHVLRRGVQPAAVSTSTKVRSGDTIVTNTDGRVVLTRAGDYIVVAPSSRLVIPQDQEAGGLTRLIQEVGTLLYSVRHTGAPHFRVDAPMLAAVVKGTSFTVIVGPDRNAVQVTDGVVEVIAAEGGMSRLVQKSETVFINRDRPADLVDAGPAGAIAPLADETETVYKISENSQALMTPMAVLTSGLAREVPSRMTIGTKLQLDASVGYVSNLSSASPSTSANQPTGNGLVDGTGAALSGAVGDDIVPPVETEVAAPVVTEVVAPVVTEVATPVVTEVAAPVVTEVVAPVTEGAAPVVPEAAAPVVTEVVAPVTEAAAPAVTEVAAPVVTEVVAPTVTEVVAPVVTEVAAPVITDVVAPVVTEVVAPVVTEVAAPVVTEVVAPVTEVAAPVVTEVAAPVVSEVAAPVVTEVAAPVVTEVAAPVVSAPPPPAAPPSPPANLGGL